MLIEEINTMIKCFLLSLVISFSLGFSLSALADYKSDLKKIVLSSDKNAAKLNRLYSLYWDNLMKTYPEWATYVGYPGQNHRWTDYSPEGLRQSAENARSTLKAIRQISKKGLNEEQTLSYDLFLSESERAVESLQFPTELLIVHQMGGIHIDIPDLLWNAPKNKIKDYQDMIERLRTAPVIISQVQSLLQRGIQEQITPPKIVLQSLPRLMDSILTQNPRESSLYAPFAEMKETFGEAERLQIQKEALDVIQSKTYPALQALREFFVKTYIPQSRETVGFSTIKNGANWYAFRVKNHTTVKMTPDEIHQLGLSEVQRIESEMIKIKDEMKFKGDLKAFNQFLKKDDQFFFKNSHEMMLGYRDIAKRIDAEMPKLFGRLPRLTYGVREMPAYKAPSAPTAYYQGGSLEAGRAGSFEANPYDLKARPKWQMEALTLHEAMPGHHMQISIAQELEGLPEFRKNMGPTSYVEGWGLYAESLGKDLGMYQELSSRYGQLTYEIWRAIRLVVDTGLHSKGWSRDQVIQYFKDHSAISEQQIINETDRYIADPGQALAYKIGELKFKELKKLAKEKLKDQFSIREFHDQLLSSGAIPMDLVEKRMVAWIQKKAAKQP